MAVTQQQVDDLFEAAVAKIGQPSVVKTDAGEIHMPDVNDVLAALREAKTLIPPASGKRRGIRFQRFRMGGTV